jgi:hypothetical protein
MAVAQTREMNDVRTEKGVSLARGPALILGTILLAAGLYCLYRQHTFPPFSNVPNGKAPDTGKVFGIFGANGWTGMLTAVAGGLLLFGAAQHLLAKTMSLIVGVALGTAAVIALISGDVLGLIAANGWTELAWGIAAAILLFNTLMPRPRRTVPVAADERPVATGRRDRAGTDRDGTAVATDRTAVAERGQDRHLDDRPADVEGDRSAYEDATVRDDRAAGAERHSVGSNAGAVEHGDPQAAEDPRR